MGTKYTLRTDLHVSKTKNIFDQRILERGQHFLHRLGKVLLSEIKFVHHKRVRFYEGWANLWQPVPGIGDPSDLSTNKCRANRYQKCANCINRTRTGGANLECDFIDPPQQAKGVGYAMM